MEFELTDFATANYLCGCGRRYALYSPARDIQAHLGDGQNLQFSDAQVKSFLDSFYEGARESNVQIINLDETPVINCDCGVSFDALTRFQAESTKP
jgi:hypothetical protein